MAAIQLPKTGEAFADELVAAPWLCRRLLEFQRQAEGRFAAGDTVQLHSLVRLPELNGRTGVALTENPDGARWTVRMSDPEREVALKAENLQYYAGSDVWECVEGGSRALRVIGRTRPARGGEARFCSVVEIACRGTKNVENWLTNFTAQLAPLEFGDAGPRVHQGFLLAYSSLRGWILEKISGSLAPPPAGGSGSVLVYVTGHSLGGALATIAAYDLAVSHGYTVRCVTWGSPRVGDAAFARAYASAVPSTARFVNRMDVVPRVPVNPDDPFDDGAVLGSSLSSLLHRAHERAGVHEYVHVCAGTLVGQNSGTLNQVLATVTTAYDQGVSAGLNQFLLSHRMSVYAQHLEALLNGGVGRTDDSPTIDLARTVQVAAGIVGGLGRLRSRWRQE